MKIRVVLPLLVSAASFSDIAAPEAPADGGAESDAGVARESMPFLGPVPEEKSKPPTLAEWNTEKDIGGHFSDGYECKLRRVREWIRFRCEGTNGLGAELVAGTPTEISFFRAVEENTCVPPEESVAMYKATVCKTRVEAVFPIRRGDRRVVQVVAQRDSNSWTPMLGFYPDNFVRAVISAAWVEDEPSPVVVMKEYDQ
jgi:hypothetical protein